jgi:hypothetical protein
MMVRVATFNLENFDETAAGTRPSLDERIALMRPQILRLRADIVCFQEVNGQERPGQRRALLALPRLLEGTNLDGANLVSSLDSTGSIANQRNLVVATHHPILAHEQLLNDLVAEPRYRRLTAIPPDTDAVAVGIERPILHVTVDTAAAVLHLINVHMKSKIPTDIPGQKVDNFTWRTADAWAEGSFLSSMKRMSQALEVRRLVDRILDAEPDQRHPRRGAGVGDPRRGRGHRQRRPGRPDSGADREHRPRIRPLHPVPPRPPAAARPHARHPQPARPVPGLRDPQRGAARRVRSLADDRKIPESDHAPVVATFEF